MDRKQIISGMIILGLVLTILEYFIADDLPVSLFIIYTTFYLSLTVVFVTEYKYYRNHDAIPASSQFLVIPLCIMLVGSFIIPNSIGKDYLEIPIWSTKFELFTSSKITSLSLIPPFFIIGKLLNNFYQGTYSGFVVRRRIHGPTKLPLFFHLIIVILFLTSIFLFEQIDFIGLLFIIWSIFFIFYKLIKPNVQSTRERDFEQGLYRPSTTSSRTTSLDAPRNTQSQNSTSRNSRREIPTTSRSGRREISTRPTQGYRNIASNTTNTNSTNDRSNPRSTSSDIQVSNGVPVNNSSRPNYESQPKSKSNGQLKKLIPTGSIRKDDLKCIVCYEAFSINGKQSVVVCPSCKFPAHLTELKQWLTQSEMCPRCNKNIKSSKGLFRDGVVIESQYQKYVNKL